MRIVIELNAEPNRDRAQPNSSSTRRAGRLQHDSAGGRQRAAKEWVIQAIKHFIDHRVDVVRRRTLYLLNKARDREHILEGY